MAQPKSVNLAMIRLGNDRCGQSKAFREISNENLSSDLPDLVRFLVAPAFKLPSVSRLPMRLANWAARVHEMYPPLKDCLSFFCPKTVSI